MEDLYGGREDDDHIGLPDNESKDARSEDFLQGDLDWGNFDEEELGSEDFDEPVDEDLKMFHNRFAEGSTQGLILYPTDTGPLIRVDLFIGGIGLLNDAFRNCEARVVSII